MEAAARSEGSTCSASSEPQSMLTQQEPAIKAAESRVTEVLQQFVKDVEARVFASLRETASEVAAHLAKEAAARMVAVERKAAFLEQELISTKSQALSMLLRLKHHADSQIVDLEKLVVAERRRAVDAESKVLTLQEALIRVKRRAGDLTCERAKSLQTGGATTVNRDDASDSLALIAGVACDVMQVSPDRSSPSEEARDNAEVEDKPDSATAASLSTRSRKKSSNGEQLSAADEQSSGEDADDGEKDGDDSGEDGTSNGRRRQSKLKRKSSKSVSTAEKRTRLMVGSKRARGKAAGASEPKQSVASSRDNRRLMQGARQLFSLAEKKW